MQRLRHVSHPTGVADVANGLRVLLFCIKFPQSARGMWWSSSCHTSLQTNTTWSCVVIFPKINEGGHIHLNLITVLWSPRNSTDTFVALKEFYRSMPLRTSDNCLETRGGLNDLTTATVFKECGVKTSLGGKNTTY